MLKIRAVQLRAVTAGPVCGFDLVLKAGLNILRADNTSGKSTCLQAIMYALGLEGMLSPRREIPLPHAMTDEIEVDGTVYPVERSFVRLEIENSYGETITVHRVVKADGVDPRLITVIRGSAITGKIAGEDRQDYFVRMPGAAQRQAGFHRFLTEFIGWNLPKVTKTDGSEVPLYIECLFPYTFVEQKHGWLSIQPRIPTYFQIRDVVRRSSEFVLGLDAYDLALKRQRLEYARAVLESEWKQEVRRLQESAASSSVVLRGLPERPAAVTDTLSIEALVAQVDGQWLTVEAEVSRLRQMLQLLNVVPDTGTAAEDLEAALTLAQDRLTAINAAIVEAVAEHEATHLRAEHLEERVEALAEDLQRHKDAALLTRLGSRHSALLGNDAHCPTCSQPLPDGFDITTTPMSADDNISFIEQELSTFRKMLVDVMRLRDTHAARVHRLRDEAHQVHAEIRSIKDTLISPSALPSIATIAQRIRTEEQIASLEKFEEQLRSSTDELIRRAQSWHRVNSELRELGSDTLSSLDREKLSFMDRTFGEQLRQYRFRSLDPANISISEDTYRPVHEGFDLGFDLSASDMIRAMWAYLVSFAETGLIYPTNHLRLLVLDEPRQQEVHRIDFAAFLHRLAIDAEKGLQVIVATSEEHDSIRMMLKESPHYIVSLDPGMKVLRPL